MKIARAALVIFGIVYLMTLALGGMKLGNPLLLLAIGGYSVIGLGASAVTCAVLMVFRLFATRRERQISN